MPGGFGDELKSRLPQLALQILAGLQGPQALGALNQGMGQSQDRAQALARQAQMDEERRAQQQAVADRAAADDTRADEAAKFARLNAALGTLDRFSTGVGETATDPVAAENQVLQRATGLEGAMGLPQGQLSPFVPNMSPRILAQKKRLAKEKYAEALKIYGPEALQNDSITIDGGELLGQMKPSQLMQLAEMPTATDAGGQRVPMMTTKPDVPNTPEEQFYATFAQEHNTTWEKLPRALKAAARKEWMQADDRPAVGADPEIAELRKDLLRMQVERAGEPKEANQAQFTAATYAGRMEQAERTFGTVAPAITTMSLPAFELQTNSWFAKPTFQSADVQSYMQAARNFINAVLRRESGAVISPSEFAEARQQYLPQPNDTPDALAQKKANRDYVFSSMKRAAGSAYEPPMMPSSPRDGAVVPNPFRPNNATSR